MMGGESLQHRADMGNRFIKVSMRLRLDTQFIIKPVHDELQDGLRIFSHHASKYFREIAESFRDVGLAQIEDLL